MNRSKAGARLSAYLEGDLSEAERSRLENELAEDPMLRESLRELENVVSVLHSLPEPELPPAFATRVLARVLEQAAAPRGVRAWMQRAFEPAVAVPLAAGITALALVIGSTQPDGRVLEGGDEGEARLADATNARPPASLESPPAPEPRPLSSGAVIVQGPTPAEVRRMTIDTNFSRNPHEELARRLRGLHPHAPSFASQIDQSEDPSLQIVSFERRRPRARR